MNLFLKSDVCNQRFAIMLFAARIVFTMYLMIFEYKFIIFLYKINKSLQNMIL